MTEPETKLGRPTVMTAEVILKLEEAFKCDATDGEACAFAGIGESTYYAQRDSNEAFREQMDRAKQFPFMLAKKTVMQAMNDKDGGLAMKWLKNRQRDRYHEKVEQEIRERPIEEVIKEVDENANYAEKFTE